VQAIKSS